MMTEELKQLSPGFQALMEEARLLAIELGYDFVGTEHVFLADCRRHATASMRLFAKLTDADLARLLNQFRKGDPSIFLSTLPLTVDVEKTIRKALHLKHSHYYPDQQVMPYHYFLAAAHLRNTALSTMLHTSADLLDALEHFYVCERVLKQAQINRSLNARLRSRFQRILNWD